MLFNKSIRHISHDDVCNNLVDDILCSVKEKHDLDDSRKRMCSDSCSSLNCFSLPFNIIDEIKRKLGNMKKSELHSFLLENLKTQKDLGLEEEKFIINKHSFCPDSVIHLLGFSQYLVKTVVKEVKDGHLFLF